MKPEEYKSLIKEIGDVVDKRAKTTEALITGEIASVRGEVRESEERLNKRIDDVEEHMHADVLAARAEAHADSLTLNATIGRKLQRHERRITNLEEHTGASDLTKH